MNALITFLTLMVFLLVTMTQRGSIPPGIGYPVGGGLAVVTFILAIVRYKKRKDAGE